jgi:hypothetical protein
MDVSRYARFLRPGHRVTGDRSRTSAEVDRRVGCDYVHAVVDVDRPRFGGQYQAIGDMRVAAQRLEAIARGVAEAAFVTGSDSRWEMDPKWLNLTKTTTNAGGAPGKGTT